MTTPDPFQLSASSLDPCVAVAITSRDTVPTPEYGIYAEWKLPDGGLRTDALKVASSLEPDGGQRLLFCFADDAVRASVSQSMVIQYTAEYRQTVTTYAGQPCMLLNVDGRFTSWLDAGGCTSDPADAGACTPGDAGDDAATDDAGHASLAQINHEAPPHTAAACSVGAGPAADVGGFALAIASAAVVLAVRRARALLAR
jgi:hypothetical protein